MKNDTIRVHNYTIKSYSRPERDGETGMDSMLLRLQESLTDETYNDGYIDYTHEL